MNPRNETHPAQATPRNCSVAVIRATWKALVVGALLCAPAPPLLAQEKARPPVPQPSVPEMFTLQGEFVRIAYNNEGFVSLGYRAANSAVGQEWMLLEVGITVRKGVNGFTLKRDAISLQTPDGKTLPMATQKEYSSVNLRDLEMIARNSPDSINYFPGEVTRTSRLGFFSDSTKRTVSYDETQLNSQTAAVGRIYFHVPGGVKTGQHWLNVKFGGSMVQVPFRILTKEEEKEFRKTWKDMKKEHDESMK